MIPYTTIPFLSAFFLVLVGVMIGHLIWYRYRDEKQHEAYQLRSRQHRLQKTLQVQASDVQGLEQQLAVAVDELTQRRSEVDRYEHQTRVWQQERETTAEQLAQERRARRDLEACLTDERNCRMRADERAHKLATQLREAEQVKEARQIERVELEEQLSSAFQRQKEQAAQLRQLDEAAKVAVAQLEQQQRISDQLTLVQHSLTEKLASARQRCLAQQSQSTHLERHLKEREQEVSDLTQRVERSEQGRASMIEQSDGLREQLAAAASEKNEAGREMQLLRARLAQLELDHEQLSEELKVSDRERGEHVDRLRLTLSQRDGALQDATQHRQQLNVLRALHLEQTQRLEQSDRTGRGIAEQLSIAKNRFDQVSQQLRNRTTERDLAKQQLASLSANVSHLRLQLDEKSNQLGQLEQARAVLSQVYQACQGREKQLEQQLAESSQTHDSQLHGLQTEIASQRGDFERQRLTLSTELNELRLQSEQTLKDLAAKNDSLQTQLKHEGQRRLEQDEELCRLESVDDRIVQQDSELRVLRKEVKDLRQQRHQAVEAESAMRAIVKELREELDERLEAIDGLQVDKDDADLRLQAERKQLIDLRASKIELQRTVDEMHQSIASSEQQRTDLQAEQSEMAARIAAMTSDLDSARQSALHYEQQAVEAELKYSELQQQLETQQSIAERTRHRRLVSLENGPGVESTSGFSFREIRSKQESISSQERQSLRRDRRYGSVFDEPPRYPDDLAAIPGLNAEHASRLNSLGIYLYRQIMVWDTLHVAAVRETLGLADSINVDDWIGHARRLFHRDDRSVA